MLQSLAGLIMENQVSDRRDGSRCSWYPTVLGMWSACWSLAVFLFPEMFPCVQDDAVAAGIACERLQAGPDAAPINSSILHIAEAKGCFFKNVLKNPRFALSVSWGKFVSCQENNSMLYVSNLITLCFVLSPFPEDKPRSQDQDLDLSHFWEAFPFQKQRVDYTRSIWCLSATTEVILIILWSQTIWEKFSMCYQEKLNVQTQMDLSLSGVTWT